MRLKIHPQNPALRQINQALQIIRDGGVIIFPTDTIYAIGCDFRNVKAFDRLCKMRKLRPSQSNFSLLLPDLSSIASYTKPFDRSVFKLLKSSLPGPFTFIMPAGNTVPSHFRNNRKTIGIRVPDNNIVHVLTTEPGQPLVSATLRDNRDEIDPYLSDPDEICERFEHLADLIIDGGYGKNTASTIVDCTGQEPVITRPGLGTIEGL